MGKCHATSPICASESCRNVLARLPIAKAGILCRAFLQLPANHLAAGQPASKLKEDLFSTANSIELFKEMLAPISANDAADVKQVWMSGRPVTACMLRLRRTCLLRQPPCAPPSCFAPCSSRSSNLPSIAKICCPGHSSINSEPNVQKCFATTGRQIGAALLPYRDPKVCSAMAKLTTATAQEYVREQAEQCSEMLTRLGALAEAETDEATLQQTLELHSALEQAMGQYETLLAVAEVRALCAHLSW